MRILRVSHYYSEHRGGVEIVASELAERLACRDVEVTWAASSSDIDSTPSRPAIPDPDAGLEHHGEDPGFSLSPYGNRRFDPPVGSSSAVAT